MPLTRSDQLPDHCKRWEGGYRAKNVEFIAENFNSYSKEQLFNMVRNIERKEFKASTASTRLLLQGWISFFKTGMYQKSFQEYLNHRSKDLNSDGQEEGNQ